MATAEEILTGRGEGDPIKERESANAIATGTDPFSSPTTVGAGAGSNDVVDAAGLPDNEKELNVPAPENIPDDAGPVVSGIQASIDAAEAADKAAKASGPTDAEIKDAEKEKRRGELEEELLGKPAAFAEKLDESGVAEDVAALKDLNLEIAQLSGEFDALELAQEGQGRGITLATISGRQGLIRREKAIKIGTKASMAQALQGNIKLSQSLAEQAVNLEFAPIEMELGFIDDFYARNQDTLNREEKAKQAENKERQDKIAELKAEKLDIMKLAIDVAQAGGDAEAVMGAGSMEEAIRIAAPALEGEEKLDTQVVEVGGQKKLINSQTGKTIRVLGASGSGGGTGLSGLSPLDKLKAVNTSVKLFGMRAGSKPENIEMVAALMSGPQPMTVDQITDTLRYSGQSELFTDSFRDAAEAIAFKMSSGAGTQFTDSIDRSLEEGNVERVKELLVEGVIKTLGTDQQKQVNGKTRTIEFLDEIQDDLDAFVALNGDTNIFKGKTEKMMEKVSGTTMSPELAKVANKIATAVQSYRRAMSGVAFSVPESDEYKAIFPNIDKVGELNKALIDSLKEVMEGDVNFILRKTMGSGAYDDLFVNNTISNDLIQIANGFDDEEYDSVLNDFR